MEIGYCPKCKQNVMLTRKEFNPVLMFILFFFTILGGFIYLFIWLSKPKDRCIVCQSITEPPKLMPNGQIKTVNTNTNSYHETVLAPIKPLNHYNTSYTNNPAIETTNISETTIGINNLEINNTTIPKFCPYCGAPLQENEIIKYCPQCGQELF